MSRRNRTHLDSFTLLELVVAVAIALILVVFLTPAVVRARRSAGIEKTVNNGRTIYQLLSAEAVEAFAKGTNSPFPQILTNTVDSTRFVVNLKKDGRLAELDYALFAAPGVPAVASGATFRASNNAWCVTVGLGTSTPALTPALFTRNIDGAMLVSSNAKGHTLKEDRKPFGKSCAVVVQWQGRTFKIVPDADGGLSAFNPTSATNSILRPGKDY